MKKQTAGRKNLGELAPKFAELNDDVLFGEVWAREDKLSARDRSLITIAALFSAGQFPQLKAHLLLGKEHGLKKQEIVEVFTQLAFYCGWPKAWSSFAMIEEVFGNEEENDKGLTDLFPIGDENVGYAKYFSGKSYLYPISTSQVPMFNVTFEPGCRNAWHIHHAEAGGGQMLIVLSGRGWYQEEGKPARSLAKGDVVNIPVNVKHWHGAAKDCYFQHIAVEVPGTNGSTEWFDILPDELYDKLK